MRLAAVWACAPVVWAQPPAVDPLLQWLDGKAQRLLDQRDASIAAVRTRVDADRRKAEVRAKLLQSIGGLPDHKGPLKARVTGTLASPTHIIDKLLFESLPGVHISANLYRPHAPGRHPAVLVPSGHTQEGKPEPQILAANLAAKGFLALTYDPIGQGEREQAYLPQLGRTLTGGGGNEHLELGARSILIGQSVARYFIFDGMRGIDYLVSRPDVDPDRIGVAGCSGGGAITTYVGALDPRVKAAAPACFVSSYRTLFSGPTADSEMTPPRFLANGLDMADLFEMAAPLPWLLLATTGDYFTPDAARPVYEEARRWYQLYGAEERIRFFVGEGPHGMPRESREETYRWMIRWLKDGQGDATELPVKLYTNHELLATATGNVDGEPGNRKIHQVILDEYRTRKRPRPVAELTSELARLGVRRPSAAPVSMAMSSAAGAGFNVVTIQFESEPGVSLEAKLYVPRRPGRKQAVVVVEDKRLPVPLFVQRSQSTGPVAESLADTGRIVLEIEVRDSPPALDGRPFLGNWLTNERVDLVGGNLAAMRAADILAGVELLAARDDVSEILGHARGVKGIWLLLAAAVDHRLARLWLDRTPTSFDAAFQAPLTTFLFDAMVPGFALHWDIADLVRTMGDRRLLWTDPTNWMNRVVPLPGPYRYRHVGESNAAILEEFLRP
jgi:cephalosporin-C deacetylase-like acetyl esterase